VDMEKARVLSNYAQWLEDDLERLGQQERQAAKVIDDLAKRARFAQAFLRCASLAVGRGHEGSQFRGPRRASYRAAESRSITGMRTTSCSRRSSAALCNGKRRSGARRSS
jgi:hypothetical protein